MLKGLTKRVRSRMATIFVALYALCLLLPAAALAFSEAPCLLESHGFVQTHVRASHATHAHAGHEHHAHHQHMHDADHDSLAANTGDDIPAPAKCCGLAFFAAVAPELGFTPASLVLAGRTTFALNRALASLPPDQLIRPPKFLS